MNVSAQIIEVLEYLGNKIGIAIDWSAENVLPYLEELMQRLVSYQIVNKSIQIGISFILTIVIIIVLIKFLRYAIPKTRYNDDWEFGIAFGSVFGIAGILGFFIWFGVAFASLLKWIYLPEFEIIQYIQTLISGVSGA